MQYCPCCSDVLLRHARAGQAYRLCQSCRIEFPDGIYEKTKLDNAQNNRVRLPNNFSQTLSPHSTAAKA